MKKILEAWDKMSKWLCRIESDKYVHLIAGLWIGFVVSAVMKDTGSDCYYMLNMRSFQKITVMSINDKNQSNWIYKNGNLQRVAGGLYFNVHQVPPELMTPQLSASMPGAGQMWSAANNNDW